MIMNFTAVVDSFLYSLFIAHPAVFIWHQSSRASLAERVSRLSSVSILITWIWKRTQQGNSSVFGEILRHSPSKIRVNLQNTWLINRLFVQSIKYQKMLKDANHNFLQAKVTSSNFIQPRIPKTSQLFIYCHKWQKQAANPLTSWNHQKFHFFTWKLSSVINYHIF